jgi:hypothetical protein
MPYGIKTYDNEGFINLHSEYSKLVFGGEMTMSVTPTRPTYDGDQYIPITESRKDSNYDMGWLTQYTFTTLWPINELVPFYHPAFSGQEIAILDIVNDGGNTWAVNLIFSGTQSTPPRLFVFANMKDVQNYLNPSGYGIVVRDPDNDIIFYDGLRPLRLDGFLEVTHPSSIKTGSRGVCGNDSTCHINFTSDGVSNNYAPVATTSTKWFHVVPSTYGGLAYKNEGSGSRNCGFLNLGNRKYAWAYQAWTSFRGTISSVNGSTNHVAAWKADYAGAAHQYAEGSCGYSGLLGLIVGAFIVVFTGGAGLLILGGALAGFALASLTSPSTPSVAFYDTDEVKDTNNPVTMLITDASYYGVSVSQVAPPVVSGGNPDGSATYLYIASPPTLWGVGLDVGNVYVYWQGTLVYNANIPISTTSITTGGYTYLRGDYNNGFVDPNSGDNGFYYEMYAVARI